MPTTTRGSSRAEAVGLAEDAGRACGRPPSARARRDDQVVRPLEADRARRAARPPSRPRRPSPATTIARQPPDALGRAARPAGTRATAAARVRAARPSVRPSRPRPAVCSSATARQTSGVPVGQPAADDVVRRADDGRSARGAARNGDRRRVTGRRRAARRRVDRLRSLELERRRAARAAAVSRSASAMMQVIRTSEVEIISMLTPASASVPNIRAA